MSRHVFSFKSADEQSCIAACLIAPRRKPSRRILIHILHGMAEHSRRYEDFARVLSDRGYYVLLHDHAGHGRSVAHSDELSRLPKDAAEIFMLDTISAEERCTELVGSFDSLVLFGHSMGSFVARMLVSNKPDRFDAVIMSGTGQPSSAKIKAGKYVARFVAQLKGPRYRSVVLDSLGLGPYRRVFSRDPKSCAWLNSDTQGVQAYELDPLCGVMFDAASYAELGNLVEKAVNSNMAVHEKSAIPVLFVSGALDPVGGNGAEVHRAFKLMVRRKHPQSQVKLFDGMRHEILHESQNNKVYAFIISWLAKVL